MQPAGTMAGASQLKTTLTNNPQDSTEIPSLFHTFGQNDVSSGEDDEDGVMEAIQADQYHAGSYEATAAAAGRRGAADGASATRVGVADEAAYPAVAPMYATRTGAAASLNVSRNRHPLSRSARNTHVLLNSTEGPIVWGSDAASLSTVSNGVAGRLTHRYSFSNSTSQNLLAFEFNSSTTGGDGNANKNNNNKSSSANVAGGGMSLLRQSSLLKHSLQSLQDSQQQHLTSEPADGYWRNGNPMSMSTTDARPVATTTVGTLSGGTSDGSPTINVNLRQRVRPTATSRTGSLNTSQITMPVVQSMSSPANATAKITNAVTITGNIVPRPGSTSVPDELSPQLHTSNDSSAESRPLPGQPGNNSCPLTAVPSMSSRSRFINVPPSTMVGVDDADERSNPPLNGGCPSGSPHQLQMQQRQQYRQFQPHTVLMAPLPPQPPQQQQQQQQDYAYGVASMPTTHFPYNHGLINYAEQGCPVLSTQVNTHRPSKAVPYLPQQQPQMPTLPPPQQYFDSQVAAPAQMAMMQSPAGEFMIPYGQLPPNTNFYVGSAAAAGVAAPTAAIPSIIQGYGYPTIVSVHPYSHVMPKANYGVVETRTRRGAGKRTPPQQQQQQQTYPVVGDVLVAPSPPVQPASAVATSMNSSAKIRNGKNKTQPPSDAVSSKKPPNVAPSSLQLDSKTTTPSNESLANSHNTTTGTIKKAPKKHDEARFHANHSATIQLFVVVKRKMEGQRYACPLPASAVPLGSKMLVEGDRGADLGEVLAHISIEQMAHDCIVIERRRKAAMEKMQEQRSGVTVTSANEDDKRSDAADEANIPLLTGRKALEYVLSVKSWPWLIGPATTEDVENIIPQREAEKQAFITAKPIVQQFIENRYQQRLARNEQALRSTASRTPADDAESEDAAGKRHAQDNSDAGEHRTSLTEEELHTLELSRQVTLVDCEYQFTREKITLFVSRPSRSIFVDFRRMQRKLYRTFRCRIWIAYMDEIADDEDAPESFVFVPPPSSAAAAVADAADENNQDDVEERKENRST